MKTQQRAFVVEYKSARRRSPMRPESIWGGADLKALAREAEAEAPHLFEPNAVSKTPSQDGQPRTDARPEPYLNDKQISTSSEEWQQTATSRQGDDLSFSSVAQLKEKAAGRRSPKVARRRRKADVNHSAKGAAIVRSITAQVEEFADELVVLDEENRRLKGLLENHFRQENMQLREMLARFGVV